MQGLEGIHKGFSVGGACGWAAGPQWVVLLSDTSLGTGIIEQGESGVAERVTLEGRWLDGWSSDRGVPALG